MPKYLLLLLLSLGFWPLQAQKAVPALKIGQTYHGKVVGIYDGDTYGLLIQKNVYKIRMDAIDAPERGMPFYKVSKQALANLIFGKEVRCYVKDIDRHDRYIGRTYMDTIDVSKRQIQTGMAWHFKEYNKEKGLANAENEAREASLGIWSIRETAPPWLVRQYRRAGISDSAYRAMKLRNDPKLQRFKMQETD